MSEPLVSSSLVLASASPRRRELLGQLVVKAFDVKPQDIDETPLKGERPSVYVRRVVHEKALSALNNHPNSLVLSADTIVVCGRRILQKARDREEARKQITLLSGRRHQVLTGVAVARKKEDGDFEVRYRLATTVVAFKRLTELEMDAFLESEEWCGVAVYRIQGMMGAYLKWLQGQPSTILGLPLLETRHLLQSMDSKLLRF